MRRKSKLKKLALLLAALLLSLILAEIVLRLFTKYPMHGPLANRVYDEYLGHRVDSSLDGIDENGFRNPVVLKQTDIVALGDSYTYGVNVDSEDSWPRQLAKMLDMSVYITQSIN